MHNYFVATLFTIVIIGLISVILGITAVFNANKSKNPAAKHLKVKNGRNIITLGSIIMVVFVTATIYFQHAESSSVWIIQLLLFPLCLIILVLNLVFFTIIGIAFLQQGYLQKKEGIYDVESIVYGFIILTLGFLMAFCLVMTFVYSVGGLGESLINGNKSRYTSSSNPYDSSLSMISNYLLSVI